MNGSLAFPKVSVNGWRMLPRRQHHTHAHTHTHTQSILFSAIYQMSMAPTQLSSASPNSLSSAMACRTLDVPISLVRAAESVATNTPTVMMGPATLMYWT